jgi:hypothetical protein
MRTAVALLAILVTQEARGADPVVLDAPGPPPVYAPVIWRNGSSTAEGYFFTKESILRTSARIDYLEQKAAKECFDGTVAADKKAVEGGWSWLWIVLGAGVGAAAGAYAHQRVTK